MRCDAPGRELPSNGWDQYVDVARSDEFQHALWVTVKFALLTVPTGLVLGVGLAVLADKYLRGARRVPVHLHVDDRHVGRRRQPDVAVPAAAGRRRARQRRAGSPTCSRWSSRPGCCATRARRWPSVAASSVWASLGFTFMLVTAGLQGIPRDLHEAAAVDGAGGIRRFWSITLPLLGPTLLFVLIVLTTRAFQAYGEIDLLTRRRAAPGELDDDDHLPDLRHRLDHQQQPRAAGGRRPCCCSSCCSCCRSSSSPASAGGSTMREVAMAGDATTMYDTPRGLAGRRALRPARRRVRDRAVPDLHDGRRRPEAGQQGARQPARARRVHARRAPRGVDRGPPRALHAQLDRRRRHRHRRPGRHVGALGVRLRHARVPGPQRAVRRLPRHAARPARGDARRQPAHRRLARLAQHVPGPGRAVPRHRVRHVPHPPGVPDAAARPARRGGDRRRRPPRVPPPRRRAAGAPDDRGDGGAGVPVDVEPVPLAQPDHDRGRHVHAAERAAARSARPASTSPTS